MLLRLEGARLVPASGEHSNITCATDRRSRRRVAGANDSPRRRHRGDAAAASRISNFLDSRAPCKGLPLACCLVLPFRFWTLRPACLRRSKLREAAYEPRGPKKSWDNTLCAGLKVHGGPFRWNRKSRRVLPAESLQQLRTESSRYVVHHVALAAAAPGRTCVVGTDAFRRRQHSRAPRATASARASSPPRQSGTT